MADSDSTSGRAPAFQFYPKDFLHDGNVVVMNLAERGAYVTLLCYCWTEGSLPADLNRLARFCGVNTAAFKKLWPALQPCFRVDGVTSLRLIHPRLERERQKQAEFKRRQSDNGRKGGRPHKPNESQNNPSLSTGLTQTEPTKSSSFSSSSLSSDFSQERARPKAVTGGGAGVGSNPRDHLYCRGNGTRCSRICISEKQHAILRAKFGGDERTSDDALDAFYAEVRSKLDPNQPIGDTPWKFWESQFAAKFGTVGAVNPRTAGNVAAAARFVARGQA